MVLLSLSTSWLRRPSGTSLHLFFVADGLFNNYCTTYGQATLVRRGCITPVTRQSVSRQARKHFYLKNDSNADSPGQHMGQNIQEVASVGGADSRRQKHGAQARLERRSLVNVPKGKGQTETTPPRSYDGCCLELYRDKKQQACVPKTHQTRDRVEKQFE